MDGKISQQWMFKPPVSTVEGEEDGYVRSSLPIAFPHGLIVHVSYIAGKDKRLTMLQSRIVDNTYIGRLYGLYDDEWRSVANIAWNNVIAIGY